MRGALGDAPLASAMVNVGTSEVRGSYRRCTRRWYVVGEGLGCVDRVEHADCAGHRERITAAIVALGVAVLVATTACSPPHAAIATTIMDARMKRRYHGDMRRLAAFTSLAFVTLGAAARADCPRTDAIALANQADTMLVVDLDQAIATLVRASKLDPSNARIHEKLARAYVKKEAWPKHRMEATAAAKLAPTFANYHWLVGYTLTKQGAWFEAKVALEAALEVDPNHADAHFDLASTLEHLHDEQGALVHYTRAIRLAPSRTDQYPALADLYLRLGYDEQAAAVAREGLAWTPPAHTHFVLATIAGTVAESRKAIPEALARYREAKDACGVCDVHDEPIAYFNLGMALAATKPPKKADATDELIAFEKRICRGGAAASYQAECVEAEAVLRRLNP